MCIRDRATCIASLIVLTGVVSYSYATQDATNSTPQGPIDSPPSSQPQIGKFCIYAVDGSTLRLEAVSYTHLRAHETVLDLVCRLLLEKKKTKHNNKKQKKKKSEKKEIKTIDVQYTYMDTKEHRVETDKLYR